jgi:hypothetical protein
MLLFKINLIMTASFYLKTCKSAVNFGSCYESTCYHRSYTTMSWIRAVTYCLEINAVLVSIHSPEENAYISTYVRGGDRCWIGLNDIEYEGVWQWIGGTPVDYTNFDSKQPDNAYDKEHTVEILTNDKWNDRYWWLPAYAICMRPAPTANPTMAPATQPTTEPTPQPTMTPTTQPTTEPTTQPTTTPTTQPTTERTTQPTMTKATHPVIAPTTQSYSMISIGMSDFIIIVSALSIVLCICILICTLCLWGVHNSRHAVYNGGTS